MKREFANPSTVSGRCLCGAVAFEIDYPAFWAWHDHTRASRLAHGAVYATYVGVWRKRFRVTAGEHEISRYEDKASGRARSFCRPRSLSQVLLHGGDRTSASSACVNPAASSVSRTAARITSLAGQPE